MVAKSRIEMCQEIVAVVARVFDITTEDLLSGSRKREIAVPKHVAIYVVQKKNPHYTHKKIGELFGMSRGTITLAIAGVSHWAENDNQMNDIIQSIIDELAV